MTTSAGARGLADADIDGEALASEIARPLALDQIDQPPDAQALGDCAIAVVHDWLDQVGGAERVLREILRCFPQSDLYAVVDMLSAQDRDVIFQRRVSTTFVQKLPGARRHFRRYLPLMPLAIEQLDLTRYDLVISSSWAVAKGVITGPDQLHVAYVHTPIRYAWEQQHQYLHDGRVDRGLTGGMARLVMHWLRLWDVSSAKGVDVWIANSAYVARRIRKRYGQRANVVHPPVAVNRLPFSAEKQDYYVTCSRLVPYKRVDVIVKAFETMHERPLVVVGDGPELPRLRKIAGDARHITFVGRQSDAAVGELLKNARAFIFAAAEDFGIAPLEAQACGTPVIAFAQGGALETICGSDSDCPTGCFFSEQTPEAIRDAVNRFEGMRDLIDPWECRRNADRFRPEAFRQRLLNIVHDHWRDFVRRERPERTDRRAEPIRVPLPRDPRPRTTSAG